MKFRTLLTLTAALSVGYACSTEKLIEVGTDDSTQEEQDETDQSDDEQPVRTSTTPSTTTPSPSVTTAPAPATTTDPPVPEPVTEEPPASDPPVEEPPPYEPPVEEPPTVPPAAQQRAFNMTLPVDSMLRTDGNVEECVGGGDAGVPLCTTYYQFSFEGDDNGIYYDMFVSFNPPDNGTLPWIPDAEGSLLPNGHLQITPVIMAEDPPEAVGDAGVPAPAENYWTVVAGKVVYGDNVVVLQLNYFSTNQTAALAAFNGLVLTAVINVPAPPSAP